MANRLRKVLNGASLPEVVLKVLLGGRQPTIEILKNSAKYVEMK